MEQIERDRLVFQLLGCVPTPELEHLGIHLRRRVLVGQQRVGTHRGEVLGEHGDAEADLRRKQLRDPGEGPLGVASLSLDVDAETLT